MDLERLVLEPGTANEATDDQVVTDDQLDDNKLDSNTSTKHDDQKLIE